MRPTTTLLLALLACCAAAGAQTLMPGDAIIASGSGYTMVSGGVAAALAPVTGTGSTMSATGFGNGAILHVPGTDLVIVGENTTTPTSYILDFSTGATTPTTHEMNTGTAYIDAAYDRQNGDVYLLAAAGDIERITSPITTTSIPLGTPVATGLAPSAAIEILSNSQIATATTTGIFLVSPGDTALAPTPTITLGGMTDMRFDPTNDRMFCAILSGHRVDTVDMATGTVIGSPLTSPELFLCGGVDYDESADEIYAISRLNSVIGGAPWGVNTGVFDNVLVKVNSAGPSSSAVGVSPMAGNGNSGGVGKFTLVRQLTNVSTGLQFDAVGSALSFGGGTFSGSLTIQSVPGLPTFTTPGQDPLVGSTVAVSGSYTGSDTFFLSDVALTSITFDIHQTTTPPAAPDVSITSAATTNAGAIATYGGALAATPRAVRRFDLGTPGVTVNGGSSSALADFATRVAAGNLSFDIRTGAAMPEADILTLIPAQGLIGFQSRVVTSGSGDVEIGIINAVPGADIYNLFTQMISTPTGSGPFLGLAGDPFVLIQLGYDLGVQPFHVPANPNGQYNFALPAGSVPMGTVVDFLTIEVDFASGTVTPLPAQTISF